MAKDIKIHGGKYLGGLTALYDGNESFKGTLIFSDKGVEFSQLRLAMLTLPFSSIVDVAVDGGESATRGISAGRVAAVGVLCLLVPKTQTHRTGYISITVASGETGIWEFEEQGSMQLKAKLSLWFRWKKIAAIKEETKVLEEQNRARRAVVQPRPAPAQPKTKAVTSEPAAKAPAPARDPKTVEAALNVRNRRKFRDHCKCLANALAPAEQIVELATADCDHLSALGNAAVGPGILALTNDGLTFVYRDTGGRWCIAGFSLRTILSAHASTADSLRVTTTDKVAPELDFAHMQPPVAEACVAYLLAQRGGVMATQGPHSDANAPVASQP